MNIIVEKANLNDASHAEAILYLLNCYAEDEMGGGEGISDYVRTHLIEQVKSRTDVIILLAWDGIIPVGLLTSFEGFSTFYAKPLINVHDLVVVKNYRGNGISIQMLRHLEALATLRGCCKPYVRGFRGKCTCTKSVSGVWF